MPTALNLTFRASPLPAGFSGTPQEFLDAIVARLAADSPSSISFFVTGSTAPTSNVGPWLKDGITWYVWDSVTAQYVPEVLDSKSVRYIASTSAPSATDYTFWIELNGSGVATAIKYYNGSWKDVYADKFATYSTTTQMNTAITLGNKRYPACYSLTADQVLDVDGNYYKVLFNNQIVDTDANFDSANNRYVAPVNGVYQAFCNIQIDNLTATAASTEIGLLFARNGAPFIGQPFSGANTPSPTGSRWYPQVSGLILLNAGDKLEVQCEANDGGAGNQVSIAASSQFFVNLVQAV